MPISERDLRRVAEKSAGIANQPFEIFCPGAARQDCNCSEHPEVDDGEES